MATTVLGLAIVAPHAKATQINGTIGFSSAPNSIGGHFSKSGGTTTVSFNNPMHVDFGNDDYAGTVGQAVNFATFSFTGSGTSATLTAPKTPEWTFTIGAKTYSFDFLNLESASVHSGTPNAIALMGDGMVQITGRQDTFATFALEGTGKRLTFDIIQSSNTAVPSNVPEGGSAWVLLGLGLIVVEGLRRKFLTA